MPIYSAEIRALSIPSDVGEGHGLFEKLHGFGDGREIAEHLEKQVNRNYGHAGPEFVEALVDRLADMDRNDFEDKLEDQVDAFIEHLDLPGDVDARVARAAKTFGLIAVAGKMAVEFEVLPLRKRDVFSGVAQCFHDWAEERGGLSARCTTKAAILVLRDFIQTNQARFANPDDAATPHNLAGYIETGSSVHKKNEVLFYCIIPSVMKREIMSKAPRSDLIEKLREMDLLQEMSSRVGQFKMSLTNGTKPWVYKISARIFSVDDNGELEEDHAEDRGNVESIANHKRSRASTESNISRSVH